MLGNWFRNARYKATGAKKKTGENTLKLLQSGKEAPALPRKLSIVQYYISRYWDVRILNMFKNIRDRDRDLWKSILAAGNPDGKKKPTAMSALNEAVAKKWAEETEEFKENLAAEQKKEREVAQEGLRRLMSPTDDERTPEEYQTYVVHSYSLSSSFSCSWTHYRAIDNASALLQPVVDAIFEKMGMVSTIILAGPTPNKGGAIKVRA